MVYLEPYDPIDDSFDILLYWEAPCTYQSKELGDDYKRIQGLDSKKILLFAGGDIQKEWVEGFDMVCVENKCIQEEFDEIDVPNIIEFGVNTEIFCPNNDVEKKYDAIHHATYANWKRQALLAEALGRRAALCGRVQDHEPLQYRASLKFDANVFLELGYDMVAEMVNSSHCVVNTSSYWGGGQRCTLEGMACGIPVVVMSDSPKNVEYVNESVGIISKPDIDNIRHAVNEAKEWSQEKALLGHEYVMDNYSVDHYRDNLLKAIDMVTD